LLIGVGRRCRRKESRERAAIRRAAARVGMGVSSRRGGPMPR
jgi:hypothetical protein